ncbi:MAG: bifunctional phosphopantothenoylcysteine decarboxylase/phosphopantothenate--cysteine ligase CoaBC [Cyclobacteriaceae bacterium]
MLAGKKILLAVCGSIAAYKTAFFVRLLVKEGAEVKVLMTDSAKDFVTPLTLATLSKNPVLSEFVKDDSGQWNNHVDLGLWADLMIIAPLSANTLGKMCQGICDNLVMATYLSAKCPVMVAPAMDLDMYKHDSTRSNLDRLIKFGHILLNAESGELASGLVGEGRMLEPEKILKRVLDHFELCEQFSNKKVLITSGPTHEAIDPVRFIGNHSSGKMGRSIATELAKRGAHVVFISGPTNNYPIHANIEVIKVTSANDMLVETERAFDDIDLAVFAAAVADYRPEIISTNKIKKKEEEIAIKLVPNPDIAKEMGKRKRHQFTVGFALETDNEDSNAAKKRASKNFDLIVLNSLNHKGAGFAHDTNKVTIFDSENKVYPFELKRKDEVARDLVDLVYKKMHE